jgi:hypothetical protein
VLRFARPVQEGLAQYRKLINRILKTGCFRADRSVGQD